MWNFLIYFFGVFITDENLRGMKTPSIQTAKEETGKSNL